MTSNAAAAVKDPQAFGTTMLIACTSLLEDDGNPLAFLDWDPETIQAELAQYGDVPQANFNKLMSAIRVVTTNDFQRSLPAFIEVCDALYDGRVNPAVFDPAGTLEIAWGVVEATLLWPPDDNDASEEYHPEILGYIAQTVKHEGYSVPPDGVLMLVPELKDQWSQVAESLTDDPEMLQTVRGVSQEKTDDANADTMERLTLMLEQLAKLQTAQTDAPALAQKLLSELHGRRDSTRARGLL